MELVLFLVVGLGALLPLVARSDARVRAVALGCAALGALGLVAWDRQADTALERALPERIADTGYTSSHACRSCHPDAYDAWHRSYHRTMTQVASPASVLAKWDGTLEDRGTKVVLSRRGDEYWAEIPDPLWLEDTSPDRPPRPPRIDVRVSMTTGSHHLQNYWARRPAEGEVYAGSFDNGALVQLPWVWLVEEGRWAPVQDSFLTPPTDALEAPNVWNTSCHVCHSVATEPRFDGADFATRSVELGIACEACHGPGEEHVRANRSPTHRYLAHFRSDDEGDPTIVNPARLTQERSAEVCGSCHSFGRILDLARWQKTGVPYRPGDRLADAKKVFLHAAEPSDPLLLEHLAVDPNALQGRFWEDGTIRVAGRELNGLLESPCYQRGEMTCLSCHSMHDYESPSDQVHGATKGDESCLQCHEDMRAEPTAHTRHAADSEGSRCMNCHLPHTTYGLFVAMRAHRVDSPSAQVSAETGRPNACNLCHLDQTLAWTDRKLHEWYGTPLGVFDADERHVAAGVLWALRGDAAQRAVTAWHMGWKPAQEAAGSDWMAAYLSVLLIDPYAAVRRVSGNALAAVPGFEDVRYDFLAPPAERQKVERRVAAEWNGRMALQEPQPGRDRLLLGPHGRLRAEPFQRLLESRDTTPLRIIE